MPNTLNHPSAAAPELFRTRWKTRAALTGSALVIIAPFLQAQPAADGIQFFEARIRPVLAKHSYQQASISAASEADMIELFAGFPRRRLSAEEIRDTILSVSGELDANAGNEHPFPSSHNWGFTQHGPFSAVYDHNKRSVYLMVQRLKRHPFLALFDGADPNASTPERRVTTVPTQALYFLNDPFVHAKALNCAERLQAAGGGEREQIELTCRLALGRSPTDQERTEAADFLTAYRAALIGAGKKNPALTALAAYVRTLFGSNEFLHCD